MKRLSVIIVTYRSERDIYDCLRSLWQHCDIPKEQLEVIVVDNSPESDGMFARLRQLYGQELLLIHNHEFRSAKLMHIHLIDFFHGILSHKMT